MENGVSGIKEEVKNDMCEISCLRGGRPERLEC
jgi:hypothetical protein